MLLPKLRRLTIYDGCGGLRIGSCQACKGKETSPPTTWGNDGGLEGRSRAGVVREVESLEKLVEVTHRVGGAPKLLWMGDKDVNYNSGCLHFDILFPIGCRPMQPFIFCSHWGQHHGTTNDVWLQTILGYR